jgi:O-antigen/teichoic acid export membrane protein
LLIPHLRSFEENGYYGAAYKFWDTLAFIPAIVSASLLPFFSETMAKGALDDARKAIEAYTRYMICLALPLTVGAFLLTNRLAVTFLKPTYAPAGRVLWILVAAVSVLFIYSPVNSLILSQKTKVAAKITIFTFLTNLTLNLIFIPKFGFVAAGWVTLISESCQWIGYTFVVQRQLIRFNLFRHFVKPIIAAAMMTLAIKLTWNMGLLVILPIGAIAYFATLLALRFFQREDLRLLFGGLRATPAVAPVERDSI